MALAYLLDPCLQHQNRAGVNNVDGWFEVFRMDTDDRATIYTDFSGTLAPARNVIDNNGRVVMIAESGVAYRVAMYLPNGELVYTQQPVFTVGSGGGAGGSTEITSSDGSINVDKTSVGSDTTFDITVARDGTDLLEYVRCDGATQIPDSYIYRPTYTEGTIMVGEQGLVLSAGHYYHVTAHVRATKSVQRDPFYDEINIRFVIDDGTTQTDCVVEKRIVDYSLGLSQEFEVSTDVMLSNNCELLFVIDGHDVQNGSFELLDVEAHKVYSGSPSIPSGVLSRVQAASIYQEKLIAGANITIENNVISATGGGGGGSTYTAGDGIDITNNEISVKDPLPASAQADAGKVLTVDSSGNANWAANPLPATGPANVGNYLRVADTSGNLAWLPLSVNEVPYVNPYDNGKFLKATYDGWFGSYAWADAPGGTVSVYKIDWYYGVTRTLFTIDDIEFSFNNNGEVTIESSVVTPVYLSYSKMFISNGSYFFNCTIPGTALGIHYSGLSITTPQVLFSTSEAYDEFPASYDITLFYTKNSTSHVIKMSVFSIRNNNVQNTGTLFFSVTHD